jgi:hypothetical protein
MTMSHVKTLYLKKQVMELQKLLAKHNLIV